MRIAIPQDLRSVQRFDIPKEHVSRPGPCPIAGSMKATHADCYLEPPLYPLSAWNIAIGPGADLAAGRASMAKTSSRGVVPCPAAAFPDFPKARLERICRSAQSCSYRSLYGLSNAVPSPLELMNPSL